MGSLRAVFDAGGFASGAGENVEERGVHVKLEAASGGALHLIAPFAERVIHATILNRLAEVGKGQLLVYPGVVGHR